MLQEKSLTNFSLQPTAVAQAATLRHEQAQADQIHTLSAELHAKHGIAVTIHLHIGCPFITLDAAVIRPLVPLLLQVTLHSGPYPERTAAVWRTFCTDSSMLSPESVTALQDIPVNFVAQGVSEAIWLMSPRHLMYAVKCMSQRPQLLNV